MKRLAPLVLLLPLLLAFSGQAHAAGDLEVGVGRADITSPTGYYMQGWVRSDAVLRGVNTRIEARAIVLKRGGKKIALVAEGLNGIANGVMHEAALRLAGRGFDDTNIIVSASHTHAAPSGYYNYGTYNTVFMSTSTLTKQNVAGALDPVLYSFEVRQLVLAITRADDDLAPGSLGWGTTQLLHLTANRSLEAHLADHGITKAYGTGKVSDDPLGYIDTIDPEVQVLRIDKTGVGPVGVWTTFADHGTVNKFQWGVYNDDHHATADRLVEERIRSLGKTPAGQDVVNAYGNTDEGDQSAGLTRDGPAAANYVGSVEADAMMRSWTLAGKNMTSSPALETKWTRICFCGSATKDGPVANAAEPGLPLFTGSEEGRGPLYDITHVPFEGRTSPTPYLPDPGQGHKIVVPTGATTLVMPGATPTTVPLTVARIDNHLIATIPGEMTVDMGRRMRGALMLAAAGHGIDGVQLSGLANEYLSYFTTPQEYDAQHYEGGSTMYGRESSVLLLERLTLLTKALLNNTAAAAPDPTDPRNGIVDTHAVFSTGATSAAIHAQPVPVQRFEHATFSWKGGLRGFDMPLGKPFITVQRVDHGTYTDDLGLEMVWRVDDGGLYSAQWEVPRDAPPGLYRFLVTGNHYTLTSRDFRVSPSTALSIHGTHVLYPDAVVNQDITYRPTYADGGAVVEVNGTVKAGGAVDRYGNCNGAAASVSGPRAGADPKADPKICAAAVAVPGPIKIGGGGGGGGGSSLPTTGGASWLAALGLLLLLAGVRLRRKTS